MTDAFWRGFRRGYAQAWLATLPLIDLACLWFGVTRSAYVLVLLAVVLTPVVLVLCLSILRDTKEAS